tara:strand:+ start:6675 stop:7016 length:342 start_codon:yes stop_codon:yes gene_type:complete
MHDLKELAKKANKGDKEALTILVLEMPSGIMGNMKPEEFSKKMEEDDAFSEYVNKQERPNKDAFNPYEEDDMDSGSVESDVAMLLENWTERDPETTAGSYYQDLKELYEKHFS